MAAGSLKLTKLGQGSGLSQGTSHSLIAFELMGVTEKFNLREEKGETEKIHSQEFTQRRPQHNINIYLSAAGTDCKSTRKDKGFMLGQRSPRASSSVIRESCICPGWSDQSMLLWMH